MPFICIQTLNRQNADVYFCVSRHPRIFVRYDNIHAFSQSRVKYLRIKSQTRVWDQTDPSKSTTHRRDFMLQKTVVPKSLWQSDFSYLDNNNDFRKNRRIESNAQKRAQSDFVPLLKIKKYGTVWFFNFFPFPVSMIYYALQKFERAHFSRSKRRVRRTFQVFLLNSVHSSCNSVQEDINKILKVVMF